MSASISEYGNVMDILDIAKKYDLIEIKRDHSSEWAIYIGSADVVHFAKGNSSFSLFSSATQSEPRVKLTALRDLVSSDECRINNEIESASKYALKPLNDDDIAANIENSLNGDDFYELFLEDDEYFVTAMKYGCKELQYAVDSDDKINGFKNKSVGEVIKKAKRFDLIEIYRNKFFSHWAIYLDSGFVVHFVNKAGNDELQLNISSSNSEKIEGIVQCEPLKDVAKQDYCVINNLENLIAKGVVKPLTEEEMEQKLKEENKRNDHTYDVLEQNCEHFVTKIKFGQAISIQAQTAQYFMLRSMVSMVKKLERLCGTSVGYTNNQNFDEVYKQITEKSTSEKVE